jgi:hypothetical protein
VDNLDGFAGCAIEAAPSCPRRSLCYNAAIPISDSGSLR